MSSGIRLAVKNQAILSILRDGGSFALDWYLDQVRGQLAAIAEEKQTDAARATRELQSSRNALHDATLDRPEEGEIERLERRAEMLDGLVRRLRALHADEDYVAATAFASRDAAWEEIGASITSAAITRAVEPQAVGGADREMALMALRADLEGMLETASVNSAEPSDR